MEERFETLIIDVSEGSANTLSLASDVFGIKVNFIVLPETRVEQLMLEIVDTFASNVEAEKVLYESMLVIFEGHRITPQKQMKEIGAQNGNTIVICFKGPGGAKLVKKAVKNKDAVHAVRKRFQQKLMKDAFGDDQMPDETPESVQSLVTMARGKMQKLKDDHVNGRKVIVTKINNMTEEQLGELSVALAPRSGHGQDDRMLDILSSLFPEVGALESATRSLQKARIEALALGSEILLESFGIQRSDVVHVDTEKLRTEVAGQIAFLKGVRRGVVTETSNPDAGDEERATEERVGGQCVIA